MIINELGYFDINCAVREKWAWVMARARASVASSRTLSSFKPRRILTMRATEDFGALPLPVTACFALVGAYSKTGMFFCAAAR